MKVDPTHLTRLLDLQDLDSALDQLQRQAGALPVHQVIAELTAQRLAARDDLIAAETRLSDATVAAERAEAEVEPVKDRLARNQARVDAGQVDAKALSTALDEIGHLRQRISDLEDIQLHALDSVDEASDHLDSVRQAAEVIHQELRRQVEDRDAAVAELARQAKDLSQQREQLSGQLSAELLALYERIRARSNGVGAARFEARRCLGCGLQATVADYNHYLAAPPGEVLRCAECDRILVVTAG
jgi:predicted  nucleic acid-binding Zn-ribbon protein